MLRGWKSEDKLLAAPGDLPAGGEVDLRLGPGDGRHVGESRLVRGRRSAGVSWQGRGVRVQHLIDLQIGSVQDHPAGDKFRIRGLESSSICE